MFWAGMSLISCVPSMFLQMGHVLKMFPLENGCHELKIWYCKSNKSQSRFVTSRRGRKKNISNSKGGLVHSELATTLGMILYKKVM